MPSCETAIEIARTELPTEFGKFTLVGFRVANQEYPVLLKEPFGDPALVRIHSACLTGEAFHSLKCDCREQLQQSMEIIGRRGGAIVYASDQEGRGIGFADKIRAYDLQNRQGLDTVEANLALNLPVDSRNYSRAASVLEALGIRRVVLLTGNPDKENQLALCGIEVVGRFPLQVTPNGVNNGYLSAKSKRLGHFT